MPQGVCCRVDAERVQVIIDRVTEGVPVVAVVSLGPAKERARGRHGEGPQCPQHLWMQRDDAFDATLSLSDSDESLVLQDVFAVDAGDLLAPQSAECPEQEEAAHLPVGPVEGVGQLLFVGWDVEGPRDAGLRDAMDGVLPYLLVVHRPGVEAAKVREVGPARSGTERAMVEP